ncbi:hypothetical protein Tco_0245499 [Tanacetum coccineum]
MPSNIFSKPPLVAEIDSVSGCIKSFPKGTSCGRDGLRAQHILDALCGEGSATATNLLKAITLVINLWLAGRCPPILAEFVASAPLTPLLKLDYGIPSIAYIKSETVASFFFMHGILMIEPLDSEEVVWMLEIIKVSGPGLGQELNIKKTKILWPSCNGVKLCGGLFPVDILRSSLGVKLLGGAVSRDTYFISGMALRRAANVIDLMGLLPQLHDLQSDLLLL